MCPYAMICCGDSDADAAREQCYNTTRMEYQLFGYFHNLVTLTVNRGVKTRRRASLFHPMCIYRPNSVDTPHMRPSLPLRGTFISIFRKFPKTLPHNLLRGRVSERFLMR